MNKLRKFFKSFCTWEFTDPGTFMAVMLLFIFAIGFGRHILIGEDLVLTFPIAENFTGTYALIVAYILITMSIWALFSMLCSLVCMTIKEIRSKPVIDTKLRNPYLYFNADHFRKKHIGESNT